MKYFCASNQTFMKKTNSLKLSILILMSFIGVLSNSVWSQTIAPGGNYIQNFDAIGTTATASLPTGWKVENISTVRTVTNAYSAITGAATISALVFNSAMSSTAGNGIYNFGGGSSVGDQAIGGISSGSASKSVNMFLKLTNSSVTTSIPSFTISYNAERYRNGSNAAGFSIRLYYSLTGLANSWIEVPAGLLSFTANADNSGSSTNPLEIKNASSISITQSLAPSNAIYFAWSYSVTTTTTTTNAQAIGIDDISIQAGGTIDATPTITGAATASAFTTTYGTASAVQTFSVSGSGLTADLVATAPAGFEVSADGATYGSTATFTQSGGSVSGSLRVRLSYIAPVLGTYNAQTIVLSSTGASSVNITTAATGNAVTAKTLTITGLTADDKEYDGTTYATLSGTPILNGVLLVDNANITLDGVYVADFSSPDVGVSIPVIVSGYSLLGSAASNYSLAQPSGLTASISISGLQSQTITFGSLANATYGATPITLTATASSGLPVSYASSNTAVATVSGNTLTIIGAGSTVITASQLGDASYNPASNVIQNFTVDALPVTITGIAISDKPYNGTTTATITGTAAFNPAAIAGDDVAIGGSPVANFTTATVGTNKPVTVTGYALTGTKAANYSLSQPTGLTAAVTVADQTITFGALSTYYVSDASFTLAATASSGLSVSYSSSNAAVATISGNTVTLVGPGTATITASQAGDSNYNAASSVQQTLTVLATPIAGWNFFGQNTIATLAATTFSANLVSTAGANTITRGASAGASTGTNSFRTTGFQNNGIATTNTDYFQITLQPAAGYQASLSAIYTNFVGTNTFYASPGVSSQFAYSLDGTNFTLIGSPLINTALPLTGSFDLSGVSALQNVPTGTTITLRYYASGQTTTGGWGFSSSAATPTANNGLNVMGALVPMPAVVTTNAASSITATAATLNGSVVANNNAITATFDYGTTTAYGTSVTATTPVSGAVTGVTATATAVSVSGLSANTVYHYKAIGGSSAGADLTFTTLAYAPLAPTVANTTANTTEVSIASGDGNPAGTSYAIQVLPGGLYVQANGSLGLTAVWQTAAVWATTTVTGLASATAYTVQVKAINSAAVETSFGSTTSFTTLVNATPELQAQVLSAFGNQCIGTSSSAASFGLTGTNLTTATVSVGPLSGYSFATASTGTYSSSLTITPSTGSVSATIFVKFSPTLAQAYTGSIAIAGGGATTINVSASGTGINTPSTVTTGASSGLTQTTATLAASFVTGCSAATAYGIEYSTTNGFTAGTQLASTNATAGSYTLDLTALNPNTTYYYKAYVVDNSGTVYGSQQSFTTLNVVAPVAYAATSVSYNSFTANWNAVSAASGYNLNVYTLGAAENLVGWTFPVSGATLTADVANANNSGKAISISNGSITSSGDSSGTGFSASTTSWTTANKFWEISVNTTGYKNIKLSSVQIASNTGPRDFKIQYKIGAGGTYTDVTGGTVLLANNWTSGVVNNLALPTDCDNQTAVYVRWIPTSTTSVSGGAVAAGGTSRIDNIYIKGSLRTDLAGYNPLAVSGTSQTVSGLTGSSTYYYEVAATAGLAVSPVSNTITVNTLVPPSTAAVLSGSASICAGASTNISVAITGGTSPYTVVYSDGSTNTTLTNYVSGSAISVSPATTTTFTLVSVTDANSFVGTGNSGTAVITLVSYVAQFNQVAPVCAGANQVSLPTTPVNPQITDAVTGTWSPAFNNTQTTTYTYTPDPGQCLTSTTMTVVVLPLATYYADVDGDGYGNAAVSLTDCTQPANYVTNASDCDDTNALVWRSGAFYVDADSDGYSPNASAQTLCYGASIPAGYAIASLGVDCNDAIAAVNPGHVEVLYNGIDDNCNGQLDEGFQLTSSLQSVSCGATLASMGSLIYTNINWSATAYRFKVVNNSTGQIQYVENNHQWFTLNWMASYDYSTAYTVSVELQIAGVWLGYYGTSCVVYSPAVTSPTGSLQLTPSQCGATLASIGTVIATTPLSGATGYRFRITDVTPGATGSNLVQVKDRSYHWFTLPMLNRYNYGSTYMVEVAVKTTGGYSGYGNACYVYTPAVPMLVSCGAVIPTAGSLVYTTSTNSVTQYRFQVTKVSDQTTVTFDTDKFWFSFRANVAGFTPNTAYSVRIAIMTAGTWSPFGDACEITSPAAAARGEEVGLSSFDVVAFPNPFAGEFKLNVTTANQEPVEIHIYDMLGKLVENRTIQSQDLLSTEIGTNYPAGMYSLIVTQGEAVKSLRVIKR